MSCGPCDGETGYWVGLGSSQGSLKEGGRRVRERDVRMEAEVEVMPSQEGPTRHGTQVTSRNWQSPGNRFSPEPPRNQLCQHLNIRGSQGSR